MLLAKWFWSLTILINVVNAGIYYLRARKHVSQQPELAKSYPALLRGFIIWSNIPWVVMGAVIFSGGATSFYDFLSPRDHGMGVALFYVALCLAWMAAFYWVIFRDGDAVLAKHKALFKWSLFTSAYTIRLYTIFMVLIGGLVMIALWSGYLKFRIPS